MMRRLAAVLFGAAACAHAAPLRQPLPPAPASVQLLSR